MMTKPEKSLLTFLVALVLCCFSVAASEVVLYTSNPPELVALAKERFEKQTGAVLKVVNLGTAEAMKRIALERRKPAADIFWSGDIAHLEARKSCFAPYVSAEAGSPNQDFSPGGLWTATNLHLMIIMINTDALGGEEPPKSWSDLLDPKWKGRVVMANPLKSGSAYTQLFGIQELYGVDVIERLVDNVAIVDKSGLVYETVANGEFPVGLTMEYAAHSYIAAGSSAVGIVYPDDGAIASVEGLALIAGSPNPENARALYDILVSKDFVAEVYAKFYRRPARSDVGEVPGLSPIGGIRLMEDFDSFKSLRMEQDLLYKWRAMTLKKK